MSLDRSELILFGNSLNYDRLNNSIIIGNRPYELKHYLEIQSLGVTHIIDLTSEFPTHSLPQELYLQTLKFPIVEFYLPDKLMILSIVQDLAKIVANNTNTLYIHCHHGRGRAPSIAMALLMYLSGISLEDSHIRVSRCRKCFLSEDQLGSLKEFESVLGSST